MKKSSPSVQAFGVHVTSINRDVIVNSDVIIVAVKPYQVPDVMSEVQSVYTEIQSVYSSSGQSTAAAPKNLRPLIVSVASAVTISDIEQKVCLRDQKIETIMAALFIFICLC